MVGINAWSPRSLHKKCKKVDRHGRREVIVNHCENVRVRQFANQWSSIQVVTLFHEIMSIFTIANKSVKNEKMANIHYFVSLVPMSSLFQMFWKQQMMIVKLSLWWVVGVDVSWIKWNRKNLLKWRILGCIKGKKS